MSAMAKAELFIGVTLIALFLYAREDLAAWAKSLAPETIPVSAHNGCLPPATEHEQLHIVLAWRDGLLVFDHCLYVGSQSAYVKGARR